MRRPIVMPLVAFLLLAYTNALPQSLFGTDPLPPRLRAFDVVHYALTLSFDESNRSVDGSAAIRFTPTAPGLDSIVLDAVAMDIRSVALQTGQEAQFRSGKEELAVALGRSYAPGETLVVTVNYRCTPHAGLFFIRADGREERHDQIWTQGEENDNRHWFPCVDAPDDKATSEVIATVQEEFTLLSNGRLVSERHDVGRRLRTFHWKQEKPHSPYLIMIAAGRYAVVRDQAGRVPLLYYVYPEDSAKVVQTFGQTVRMMKFFEDSFAFPYPWDKYAQIIIDDFVWGGMENTSAVTLNAMTMVDSRSALEFPSDAVVAHELAHQWWGDLVTCSDWKDLWLHEGPATYCEALYADATRGADEFEYAMIMLSAQIRNNERLVGRKPIVSAGSHPTNLYARGAWVLHMLRNVVGETAFWGGMRQFLTRFAYRSATTADLQHAFEEAYGQGLGWFFDQWLYGAGLPRLMVTKSWDAPARALSVKIEQTQSTDSLTGYFRFPFSIECTTTHGKTVTYMEITQPEETVRIALDAGPPLMVIADKGYRLLKEMVFPKPTREYLYQLRHAEDVADRITAARALPDSGGSEEVVQALALAARSDRFWGVRQAALIALSEIGGGESRGAFVLALADSHSLVRNTAVECLAREGGDEDAALLDSVARRDTSFFVASTCIRRLAELDTARGSALALEMLGRPSYRHMLRSASLEALRDAGDHRGAEAALPYTTKRYDQETRRLAIAVLGSTARRSAEGRRAVGELLDDADPGIRAAAAGAAGSWHDDDSIAMLKAREGRESDPAVREAIRRALSTSGDAEVKQ
ncbi:MAG: M1 family aminopeptidase [Bacteroidota bacterium]